MSEIKYTPGPWKMKNDGFVYSVTTGERVCSPHSTLPEKSKYSAHIKDLKANAHLIAAAPFMYEALMLVFPRLENLMALAMGSYGKNFNPKCETDIRNYKIVQAALDKARGEE